MDDKNGTLSSLREEYQSKGLIKRDTDIKTGDIIYQNMDEHDGLVLNQGYPNRRKYIVVVGKKSDGSHIGVCLINSNISPSLLSSDFIKYQYPLKMVDYPDVLKKDSWLDCSELFSIPKRKSVAVAARIVGHLTDTDTEFVMRVLRECPFIDEHTKKVFSIKKKEEQSSQNN